MAPNKDAILKKIRKFKDKAIEATQKGKLDQALENYSNVVNLDPSDLSTKQNVANLQAKLGQKDEALATYMAIAENYQKSAFMLKAIATCKIILQLEPTDAGALKMLDELNQERDSEDLGSGSGGNTPIRGASPEALAAAISGNGPPVGAPPPYERPKAEESPAAAPIVEEPPAEPPPPPPPPPPSPVSDLPLPPPPPPPPPVPDPPSIDVLSLESPTAAPPDVFELSEDGAEESGTESVEDLHNTPLFSNLSDEDFGVIVSGLEVKQVEAGETIITEGEHGDSMYILARGGVDIVRNTPEGDKKKIASLEEGAFFGEVALIYKLPRLAGVVASEQSDLLVMKRKKALALAKSHPQMKRVLLDFCRRRILNNLLNNSALFRAMDDSSGAILNKFRLHNAPAGEVLLKQGEAGSKFYVILRGSCDVSKKDKAGEDQYLATMKEGDFFGEISLLENVKVTATVVTESDSSLLYIARNEFLKLLGEKPEAKELVEKASKERQINADIDEDLDADVDRAFESII